MVLLLLFFFLSCSDAKNLEDFDSKGWVGQVGKDVHLTRNGVGGGGALDAENVIFTNKSLPLSYLLKGH